MVSHGEQLEAALCACIDDYREEGVRLLQELVRTPSYSGEEGIAGNPSTMVGKVHRAAVSHNTEVDIQPVSASSENVIEIVRGRGDTAFVLEAHTDIVPEGEAQHWYQGDPFSGAEGFVEYLGNNQIEIDIGTERYRAGIRDQMARVWEQKRRDRRRPIIYGRGSFDNKGCVVPVMLAMQALSEVLPAAGVELNGSVIAAYTVDEETDCTGIKRFASGHGSWMATHGFLNGPTDAAGFLTQVSGIALDGSYGWVPVVGHRGSMQFSITVHGRAAHAATPQLGINAVEAMSRILLTLTEGERELTDRLLRSMDPSLLGPPTFAIGTTIVGGGVRSVRGGAGGPVVQRGGVNSIPEWCEATVDIRFPVGHRYPEDVAEEYDTVFTVVHDFLAERLRPNDWSYEVAVIEGSTSPPVALGRGFEDTVNLQIVQRARHRGQQILGYTPELEIAPGGTDATFMIHEGRIPTLVEFGPAGALSHNVHEFVERDDIIAGAKILALLAVDELGLAA
jgi:acetylornithine deacetylase/succinyl-diaminopimelate desuccinylase-like protein